MLLLALIFYLHYEAPEEEQNFAMVMEIDVYKRQQMSYSELKSLFREAENNRQHPIAHIVFTADTFKKPYSE